MGHVDSTHTMYVEPVRTMVHVCIYIIAHIQLIAAAAADWR